MTPEFQADFAVYRARAEQVNAAAYATDEARAVDLRAAWAQYQKRAAQIEHAVGSGHKHRRYMTEVRGVLWSQWADLRDGWVADSVTKKQQHAARTVMYGGLLGTLVEWGCLTAPDPATIEDGVSRVDVLDNQFCNGVIDIQTLCKRSIAVENSVLRWHLENRRSPSCGSGNPNPDVS